MQPRHVLARRVGPYALGDDLVQVELRGVDQAGVRRALGQQFARHEAARVQADGGGGQGPGTAHRDQVGGAGARTDEVHGHVRSFSSVGTVGPTAVPSGFVTDHWVTGIACRQPVKPPTGTACATASFTSSPPWRR